MAAVRFSAAGEVLYAYLSGEVDHDAAQSLRIQLDDALVSRTPQTLVLDFSGVGFMDSSGIGLILGRQRSACTLGTTLQIRHPVHGCTQNGGMTHESGKHHKDPV